MTSTVNYGVQVDLAYKSTFGFLIQNSGLDLYFLNSSIPKHTVSYRDIPVSIYSDV